MIHLTKNGLEGTIALERLADEFAREHVFRLPQVLHLELLRMITLRLDDCAWITRDDADIAREAVPDRPAPASILDFAINTPGFIEIIRQITHFPEIVCFGGRLYRMSPGANHFDSWHTDSGAARGRLVGMSINLSARPYRGGVFRLRDRATGEILCELPNTGQGDAIFFRIASTLEHMVTPIEGSDQKTAFAGWFRSDGVNFYRSLRGTDAARQEV